MKEEVSPDKEKAKALLKMGEELFRRVQKLPLEEFPTPNLSDLYDIIHMLIDANLILRGIKFKGEGAHFELIEEAKILTIISVKDSFLIQQIRGLRNRYKYEGFNINEEYISRNKESIFIIINKLHETISKELTK